MNEQPLHEQGNAVARRDPWYTPWHSPITGQLIVHVEPVVAIEMDEYMAIAYLEAFGDADPPTVPARVVSASFVLYEGAVIE